MLAGLWSHGDGTEAEVSLRELAALAVEEFGSGAEWFPDAATIGRTLAPQLRAPAASTVTG